jgi:phosphatidate cytidylyltransferase
MSEKMKNFITRTIFGALFVIVMVGGIVWRPDSFILLFAIITGLTVWEYTGLVNDMEQVQVNRFISTVAGVYFFLAMSAQSIGLTEGFIVFIPYVLTMLYLMVSELFLKQPHPINDWAYTMLGQMYIAIPFSLINVLAFQNWSYNYLYPLSIFIFLWVNDSGAYCVGSLLGKHKLFPRVSPGKSWEGSIGGAILVILIAYAIGVVNNMTLLDAEEQPTLFSASLSIAEWIGMGLVVVVFGTLGDLVESLFKRTLGIKDSGNILPGHGGMLDRFDSSILAIPAAVVYLYTLSLM